MLRAQLSPHFIFNALNNLRALINEDQARARDMITLLSNMLRQTLYQTRRDRVSLAEELALVRDYLELEQLHYEDRLRVRWQVAAGVGEAQLPPMLLQLLVENAIKHGIACTPGGGEVSIAITREQDRLQIAVRNPGRWSPGEQGGIGLANLRQRLARASGPGSECRVVEAEGHVCVSLTLAAT
jgi:LytS/YehU family sensor histidine kinase